MSRVDARQLLGISAELVRLAEALTYLEAAAEPAPAMPFLTTTARIALAQALHRERRLRDTMLGGALFGEPAWDILLDLYACQQAGTPICISSACLGAAAPQTTALRYITRMLAEGQLVRETDAADRRRSWVRLSDATLAQVEGYLDRVAATRAVQVG